MLFEHKLSNANETKMKRRDSLPHRPVLNCLIALWFKMIRVLLFYWTIKFILMLYLFCTLFSFLEVADNLVGKYLSVCSFYLMMQKRNCHTERAAVFMGNTKMYIIYLPGMCVWYFNTNLLAFTVVAFFWCWTTNNTVVLVFSLANTYTESAADVNH